MEAFDTNYYCRELEFHVPPAPYRRQKKDPKHLDEKLLGHPDSVVEMADATEGVVGELRFSVRQMNGEEVLTCSPQPDKQMTVLEVKQLVLEKTGAAVHSQSIIHDGSILENATSLNVLAEPDQEGCIQLTVQFRAYQGKDMSDRSRKALKEAMNAVDGLNRKNLMELNSMHPLPQPCQDVLTAVGHIVSGKPKELIGDPQKFIAMLKAFDPRSIRAAALPKIQPLVRKETSCVDVLKRQSIAAKCLYQWVLGMHVYLVDQKRLEQMERGLLNEKSYQADLPAKYVQELKSIEAKFFNYLKSCSYDLSNRSKANARRIQTVQVQR